MEIIEPFYLASFQALASEDNCPLGLWFSTNTSPSSVSTHHYIISNSSNCHGIILSCHLIILVENHLSSFIIIVFGRSSVIICLRDSALGSAICKSIAANQLTISGSVILSCNIAMSRLRTKDIKNWPSRAPRLCFWLLNCYCKECS